MRYQIADNMCVHGLTAAAENDALSVQTFDAIASGHDATSRDLDGARFDVRQFDERPHPAYPIPQAGGWSMADYHPTGGALI